MPPLLVLSFEFNEDLGQIVHKDTKNEETRKFAVEHRPNANQCARKGQYGYQSRYQFIPQQDTPQSEVAELIKAALSGITQM